MLQPPTSIVQKYFDQIIEVYMLKELFEVCVTWRFIIVFRRAPNGPSLRKINLSERCLNIFP
jgi:hypothetical protein